jgi:hypothetical protein
MKKLVLLLVLILCFSVFAACSKGNTKPNDDENIESTTELKYKSFTLVVYDPDGNTEAFAVSTDYETVGEILLEKGYIDGEVSKDGLLVKTVNGITLDQAKDGMHWAFYINGEYAVSNVDKTPVTDGFIYEFRAEK